MGKVDEEGVLAEGGIFLLSPFEPCFSSFLSTPWDTFLSLPKPLPVWIHDGACLPKCTCVAGYIILKIKSTIYLVWHCNIRIHVSYASKATTFNTLDSFYHLLKI